ncbi:hypothetical protein PV05_09148 [Exophiala xenobiotica]|uniref:Carboxymuconolactone decarboxylase-like domain-containing protein n=1 Tax=Exophiala xenobiotica TaxID=348802 RepID=A0A0D2BM31_9EURO|nr:uncharacterized protein PV05_09148 [Exophiala xenobiotica]KIW53591.1 hypothetical protein PV05_09148 [Exophiala xenobiotica]
MSSRLGLVDPASLSAEQKEAYDIMEGYTTHRYGESPTIKREDGCLLGPFGVQLHLPGIAQHFVGIGKTLLAVSGLSARAREVAINVVGAHTKAAYEHAAHARVALTLGFSKAQLDEIESGVCPADLGDDEMIAFDVATELLERPGPLREDVWQRAVGVLGKNGAMVLVQYIGWYRYIATILNGFDVQVPE